MPTQLGLFVGQTATNGTITYSEPNPPPDAVIASDNPAVATASLAADGVTWGAVGVSPGVATFTVTGTSALPDVGPVVVDPMVVTVSLRPAAETGVFNPGSATLSP